MSGQGHVKGQNAAFSRILGCQKAVQCRLMVPLRPSMIRSSECSLVAALVRHALVSYSDVMPQSSDFGCQHWLLKW